MGLLPLVGPKLRLRAQLPQDMGAAEGPLGMCPLPVSVPSGCTWRCGRPLWDYSLLGSLSLGEESGDLGRRGTLSCVCSRHVFTGPPKLRTKPVSGCWFMV